MTEKNYPQFVHTDSDRKQCNNSLPPSPDTVIAYQDKLNMVNIQVHQFNDPSTIQEQFTREQLESDCSYLINQGAHQ